MLKITLLRKRLLAAFWKIVRFVRPAQLPWPDGLPELGLEQLIEMYPANNITQLIIIHMQRRAIVDSRRWRFINIALFVIGMFALLK